MPQNLQKNPNFFSSMIDLLIKRESETTTSKSEVFFMNDLFLLYYILFYFILVVSVFKNVLSLPYRGACNTVPIIVQLCNQNGCHVGPSLSPTVTWNLHLSILTLGPTRFFFSTSPPPSLYATTSHACTNIVICLLFFNLISLVSCCYKKGRATCKGLFRLNEYSAFWVGGWVGGLVVR